jgi:hypothetical protein
MLGTIEFNFPIGGPNNGFVGKGIRFAVISALVTTHGTRLVRASADVNHVRHWSDYIANCSILLGLGDSTPKSRVTRRNCSS